MDFKANVGFLEPDILLLNSNPSVVEELFSLWLSLPATGRLVKSLIADAKLGASLDIAGNSIGVNSVSSIPPLPPRKRILKQIVGSSLKGSPPKLVNEPLREVIPQFYFKSGHPIPSDMKDNFVFEVNQFFSSHLDGVQIKEFKSVTKVLCKLPSFLSTALFWKIDSNRNGNVSREQFIHYWISTNMLTMDLATQVYTVLKDPERNYLVQDDFKPALQELMATHQGLEFLQSTPEFQEIYAETVIYRIFYYINRSGNGRITLRELKRGNLIAAMQQVDEEEDINKVLKYFSYEHFYVLYHTFMELDDYHDFLIDKGSFIRYGNYALTYRIVDRIFSEIPREFTSCVEGKMSYEDFVHFMLAEEDKSSEPSLEYWFKCIDLDENGVLTRNEMHFFLEEQLNRIRSMGHEPVLFENILCQIFDMIGPENEECITLRDIKGCKLAGTVFDIIFNIDKFTSFQNRDFFQIRLIQEHEDPTLTEWDRFAHREYVRMVNDVKDAPKGSGDDEDASDDIEDVLNEIVEALSEGF